MSLVSTVGGSTSNSYVSLADAETYFDDRINSAVNGNWENTSAGVARTDAEKSAALVTASRRIDEEQFVGYKVSTTQALKFPRYGAYDEDGIPFSTTAIPEVVKQATCLTALELLRADFLQEDYMGNFSYFQSGTVQIKQFSQSSTGKLPAEARRLLRYLLLGGGGGRIVRA
jgi:hypothetical protein